MSSRSLNKVQLIGNLTRDPELRYTPQGTAVCSFGLATNRSWSTDAGDKREETEFHRIVAWNKLAELCAQLLFKGRKVYVEGRLQTRNWTGQDGSQRQVTEVVIEEMIILDSQQAAEEMRVNRMAAQGGVMPATGQQPGYQPEPITATDQPTTTGDDSTTVEIPDDLGGAVGNEPVANETPVGTDLPATDTSSEKVSTEEKVDAVLDTAESSADAPKEEGDEAKDKTDAGTPSVDASTPGADASKVSADDIPF